MSGKNAAIAIGLALFVGAAIGRLAAPTRTQLSTQTQKTEQLEDHSKITKTEQKKPDGSVTTITTIEKNVGEKSQEQNQSEKIVQRDSTHLLFSLIGAVNPVNGSGPVWGASVQGRVFGPIWIGGQALSNGQLGASIGLSF